MLAFLGNSWNKVEVFRFLQIPFFLILLWPLHSHAQHQERPALELIKVQDAIPGILVDIRYATENNFTGRQVYQTGIPWLRKETVGKLKNVQAELKRQGYQLVILDAYRPAWAQERLWEAFPNAEFVAPPSKISRHTRGTTVDITLADLNGNLVAMPSNYDEFTERASHFYKNATPLERKHRNILRSAMFNNGFSGVPAEWWHYDIKGWQKYPPIVDQLGPDKD